MLIKFIDHNVVQSGLPLLVQKYLKFHVHYLIGKLRVSWGSRPSPTHNYLATMFPNLLYVLHNVCPKKLNTYDLVH